MAEDGSRDVVTGANTLECEALRFFVTEMSALAITRPIYLDRYLIA